jgi:hypothetical protein
MMRTVQELLALIDAKNAIDPEPYWGLPQGRPTAQQIRKAIDLGRLTPWPQGGRAGPKYQGNEEWHLGRIAWLKLNWTDGHPIELIGNDDLDGAHRVFAAHFKGIVELEVFRKDLPTQPLNLV